MTSEGRVAMLASVKSGLFHPRLPSLRRMDMDDVSHRLPEEHSRTTTSCGPRDFSRATSSLFERSQPPLAGANVLTDEPVTSGGGSGVTVSDEGARRGLGERYSAAGVRRNWSRYISASGEFQLPAERPSADDFRFKLYAVRYMKPDVSQSWRYTLGQEPRLDQGGRRPVPANVYARHRETYPQYSRDISTEAWR